MRRVVHFDIPADHLERAKQFYSSVFGWELADMPEMDYTVVKTTPVDEQTQLPSEPGAINGGMYRRSADTPSAPVLMIDVNSVDDSLKEIEAAGGRVLRPRTLRSSTVRR
jgi:predicted enzyme related to lactoylglutathione lyase